MSVRPQRGPGASDVPAVRVHSGELALTPACVGAIPVAGQRGLGPCGAAGFDIEDDVDGLCPRRAVLNMLSFVIRVAPTCTYLCTFAQQTFHHIRIGKETVKLPCGLAT